MADPLTYKLELPPVVPRDHFSGECEDVRYEPGASKRRGKPWIDGDCFDPNEEGNGVPV